MTRRLKLVKFKELSLDDPFFDSLKQGYAEFPNWFAKKSDEEVYVVVDDLSGELTGMIYLKRENGTVNDIEPPLPDRKWLKVGTLKIVGKGTKLGERVIKKIFDTAVSLDADGIYVTVFELHSQLIKLFKRYGFIEKGKKVTDNGKELVLVRSLRDFSGDRTKDYPFIHTKGQKAWLLAIYPDYHTELLPDSILRGEPAELVRDVSHTNTIHKIYIAKLSLTRMSPGDIVVFYRTTDRQGEAYFRSVISSICVVEEVKSKKDFENINDFLDYAKPRSVFPEQVLRDYWNEWRRLYVVKLTYNVALTKRTTRGRLIEEGVISDREHLDIKQLSQTQLDRILELGEVNPRLIIK